MLRDFMEMPLGVQREKLVFLFI